MAYQSCRWYDPYPRLAFALKLMAWVPGELRAQGWRLIIDQIQESLSAEEAAQLNLTLMTVMSMEDAFPASERPSSARQYDRASNDQHDADQVNIATLALLMLKHSPDSLKLKIADQLLILLEGPAAGQDGAVRQSL